MRSIHLTDNSDGTHTHYIIPETAVLTIVPADENMCRLSWTELMQPVLITADVAALIIAAFPATLFCAIGPVTTEY